MILIEAAYYKLKNYQMSIKKIAKGKELLHNIQKMLNLDPAAKKKHCLELVGSLSEEGEYFDNILIDILSSFVQEYKN